MDVPDATLCLSAAAPTCISFSDGSDAASAALPLKKDMTFIDVDPVGSDECSEIGRRTRTALGVGIWLRAGGGRCVSLGSALDIYVHCDHLAQLVALHPNTAKGSPDTANTIAIEHDILIHVLGPVQLFRTRYMPLMGPSPLRPRSEVERCMLGLSSVVQSQAQVYACGDGE